MDRSLYYSDCRRLPEFKYVELLWKNYKKKPINNLIEHITNVHKLKFILFLYFLINVFVLKILI